MDIEAWEADELNESVYWLKGVAGCGKSTIAQTFAERSAAKGKLGASFFALVIIQIDETCFLYS